MAALRDDELAGLKSANAVLRAERDAALAREAALTEALAARTAELAECNSEHSEALEQQAATAEILQIINASPGDLLPVFDAVLERAMRLCEAAFGSLYTYDGERFHSAAQRGVPAAYADFRAANPPASQPGGIIRRVLEANRPIQVLDVAATDAYRAGQPSVRALADLGGAQTNLLVPLRKDEAVLGVISIYRQEVRAFSDRQIALLENFAAQAVIAMENARLLGELQQRTSDLQESLEYQTATGDVLKVISQSTFDLPPVLETLLETAARLCNADLGAIAIREGDVYRMAASYNPTTPEYDAFFRGRLMPADRGSVTGRTVLEGRIIHVADVTADPEFALVEAVKLGGARTVLGVPLLREGAVAGVIILGRKPVQPFADRQIELVATFADQAVIAIENTRLLTEQREALEQQTATAEVLQVINSSPGNLEPVFEVILEKAHTLCGAAKGAFVTFDGQHFQVAATRGLSDAYTTILQNSYPDLKAGYRVGEQSPREQLLNGAGLIHLTGSAVAVGPVGRAAAELEKIRALLFLPLRRDGALLGYITAYGMEESTFCDKQIALLKNFAAQAVIAMENARLITETREALEQQTATAEVLQVINSSPGDLGPVFDAMLERAMALCEADYGHVYAFEDGQFSPAAIKGDPGFMSYRRQRGPLRPQGDGTSALERLIAGESVVWAADVHEEQAYRTNARFRELADSAGIRSMATIALRKEDSLRGAIIVYRRQVRPFSQKQIALLRNFAEQAVIAMENARLITETREALEQQTATAEVLQVINTSPGNVTPVFEAMLEKAIRLCGGVQGALWTLDGERVKLAASRNPPEFAARLREHAATGVPEAVQQTMRSRLLHIPDFLEHELYLAGDPIVRAAVELGGFRSWVGVALVKDDAPVGAFVVGRRERRPFTEKQIALLQNFAAQAVIAMENARLITETREALEQQTATTEVLQVINSSPGDLAPVFDATLERAMHLCDGAQGTLWMFDGEQMRAAATAGYSSELAEQLGEWQELHPFQRRLSQGERVFQIIDLAAEELYRSGNPLTRAAVDIGGIRTVAFVALVKDATILGGFTIGRREVRAFTDKQIALLENFAAQAVIAMENARLLTETREALEQQTATAEVLRVINGSPGNLAPVFEVILEKAHSLCGAAKGAFITFDGQHFQVAATRGLSDAYATILRNSYTDPKAGYPVDEQSPREQLLNGGGLIHLVGAAVAIGPVGRAAAELEKIRAVLFLPLRRDGALLGYITAYGMEEAPFSDKQIALLQNFAAQAVIAMENARLITETREALEQQTATAEVLQVINSSPGDLEPVFEALLDRAMRLCGANFGEFQVFDGERLRLAAFNGVPSALAEFRRSSATIPTPGPTTLRMRDGANVIHAADLMAEDAYREGNPHRRALVDLGGARTVLAVALRKDDKLLGAINIYRQEVKPFSERQVALLQSFAAQAVIAMENARLMRETSEALEQQTATAEVLQVINASPGDLTPVFDAILEEAHSLCGAIKGAFITFDGEHFNVAATRGLSGAYATILRNNSYRRADAGAADERSPERSPREQLLKGADLIQLIGPEVAIGPIGRAAAELENIRTVLFVPLRRDGALLGYITAYREEESLFSDKEIVLLQNFAAQAVIAMENARLITETREALEQQTATAEVLQVINASPGDLDTMLDKALDLCGAAFGNLWTYDGEEFQAAAVRRVPRPYADVLSRRPNPLRTWTRPGTVLGQIAAGSAWAQILDAAAEEAYSDARAVIDLGRARTIVGVALRKDGNLVGAITVYRQEVRPFSDKQVALLQNFAAQAVIAMDNARLLTETRESLEQQTAAAEVLQVINTSPGNLEPVFDAILEKALHLCESPFGLLATYDDEFFHTAAQRGLPQGFADLIREPFRPPPGLHNERLVRGEQLVHVSDITGEEAYRSNPTHRALADQSGARTAVWIALCRDDTLLGVINIYRQEVRPFSDRQIELLRGFAAQAVIAIDNARLLRELRQRTEELARRNSEYGERIEQQSATIDVLKAMSASSGDAQPVFQAIVERARAFCNADNANLALVDGGVLHPQATTITDSENAIYMAQFPRPVDTTSLFGRAILARDVVQTPDVRADAEHFARTGALSGETPVRALVAVPLLRAGMPIGAIVLARNTPGEFSATQVELLRTFAEQAVIAISSAETYSALQERTAALARRNSEYGERIEQQAATIDVLKVMSASPGDAQPVFKLIVERARTFCEADGATLALLSGDLLHLQAYVGYFDRGYEAQFPRPISRATMFGRAILARDVVQAADVSVDSDHYTSHYASGRTQRAIIAVPLLRAGVPVGAVAIGRGRPGEFSGAEVELLRTFAEQAVIAISSAETFGELQRRTADLTRSVAELQALEEVLRAVNSSLELETVLSTIISRAVQLSDADEGTIYEFDDAGQVFVPKSAYGMTTERVTALRDRRIRIGDETPLGKCAAMRAPLHISDLTQTPDIDNARDLVEDGIHALLAVPLLRDDKVLGGLVIRRRAVGGFAPTVPTLLQTFAGQSVLAIENARLFQEARQARVEAEKTLADLRRTQDRLVQSEKMASLGQLTAGIAHEIKNPLNFVNNFSELSVDLLDELHEAVAPDRLAVADGLRSEIDELTATLKGNLEKIAEHGRRADSIVKNMLLHSRSGPGEHRMVDLNSTVEEALNLAYHGARAATPGFNITMEKRLDPQAGMVDMYPQEITRVLLNLIGNGFYAAHQRTEAAGSHGFEPTLRLTTRNLGDEVEIRVRDNGTGISEAARDRIFEPFFTTKPAGEGTGLGLSLSYEIIVQQHGGRLTVDSEPDAFTEFVVTLPRKLAATNGGQA